jgi:cytoskeletal protein CcmA (bactofilin family)
LRHPGEKSNEENRMWTGKKRELPREPEASVPPAPAPPIPTNPSREGATTMTPSEPPRPILPTGSGGARVGAGLQVKGEISGNDDLLIDGSVEGHVHLGDRRLTIGSTAKVTADIQAREVVVFGKVKGNLRARDRIEIKKDGSVVGDLTTARIMIEDGAYFKGSIEIERPGGSEASDHSAARPVASARS